MAPSLQTNVKRTLELCCARGQSVLIEGSRVLLYTHYGNELPTCYYITQAELVIGIPFTESKSTRLTCLVGVRVDQRNGNTSIWGVILHVIGR